jgi:DNA ligase-1
MIEFAAACDAVAATPAKSLKVERLAAYFRSLEPADLAAAARFTAGKPLGAADERKLAIGGRTILAAARRAWSIDDAELTAAYRETGDLGEALGPLLREPAAPSLFREVLTPAGLAAILDELASAGGPSAGKKREHACERILRACRTDREAVYAIKILTGDLRIGLREGLVLDALAAAFEREPAAVRRAAMAAGDAGAVALAARAGTLGDIEVRYGAPIGFMLASPLAYGSAYRELAEGAWLVEHKYDGIRAQAHKRGETVRLYSRTFSEISRAFPEVIAALQMQHGDFILDGEIVARREGRVLPFRYLQPRLQRVDPSAELQAEIPVTFVAFDLLADGAAFLIDQPLVERRASLAARLSSEPTIEAAARRNVESAAKQSLEAATWQSLEAAAKQSLEAAARQSLEAAARQSLEAAAKQSLEAAARQSLEAAAKQSLEAATWQTLEPGAPPEVVAELFEAARAEGHEGLVFKRSDAPYAPGRRGKWWLKLKRELSTLDCVVVAVEWGHGKRAKVLSDYTFAVRRSHEDATLLPIGKAYTGLTDAEIAEMTAWFLEHRTGTNQGYAIAVEPSVVVEIAFDIIQKSTLHASGYALRFPRIARLRRDKPAAEADTLADVERIYAEMLDREGVAR